MDPDEEGRIQVRIHGLHDDENAIPTISLPWSKPLQDVTSAAHNKIGSAPVGAVVGTTVFGVFLDGDQQYPIHLGTISKAGDPASGSTSNGSETLIPGTNSTPPGARIANNAFSTRANKNIQTDDQTKITYPNYSPPQQNDSDGKDIVQAAIDTTKFATNPTVASILNPVGSILSQLQRVDPRNLNAVLPNAIQNFVQIQNLNAFSSMAGSVNVLGQGLGMALSIVSNVIGPAPVINALGLGLLGATLSPNASQALYVALSNFNQPIVVSQAIGGVIMQSLNGMTNVFGQMIQGGFNTLNFESAISSFLGEIQTNGALAVLGIAPQNIMNELASVLPSLTQSITNTVESHLPISVLNPGLMNRALQNFAMNQAFLKAPIGKKALAILACQPSINQMGFEIASIVSSIPGVTGPLASALANAFLPQGSPTINVTIPQTTPTNVSGNASSNSSSNTSNSSNNSANIVISTSNSSSNTSNNSSNNGGGSVVIIPTPNTTTNTVALSITTDYTNNLTYYLADLKSGFPESSDYNSGTALYTNNYQTIISGLVNNAKCNGIRMPIIPTLTSNNYPQINADIYTYAQYNGLVVYASPLSVGTNAYSTWTDQQYAEWIADYVNNFNPEFVSPFNESGRSPEDIINIVNLLKPLLAVNVTIVGPDDSAVSNTIKALQSNTLLASCFDVISSHNDTGDTSGTVANWEVLGSYGKPVWNSETHQAGISPAINGGASGLVIWYSYPALVTSNGNLTQAGSNYAALVTGT